MVEMADLLQFVVDEGASDLHIEVGAPPMIRLHGEMTPLELPALTPADTERLVKAIASESQLQQIQEVGTTDFGFGFADLARFLSGSRRPRRSAHGPRQARTHDRNERRRDA